MRRCRIAFVTDIVTPYAVATLEALAQRCELTVLFSARTGTRGLPWSFENGLPFRYEIVEGLTVRRSRGTDRYPSPRVIAAIRRARPQAIISGGYSFPSLYAAAYARATGVPLLIQSDGTSRTETRLGFGQRLTRRMLSRLAWGAVANSEAAARRLVEIGFSPERVFRAPHATRSEPFWHVAENRRAVDGPSFRLLTVGRLDRRKGIDLLLRAMARASAGGTAVDLVVVGSGPEEARLRALADTLGVVTSWRGFVDQPDLPALYAEADAFAFPTLYDTFGIVVLEAAAAGLPLIASPYAGATEELVRDGVNGIVVDPRDTTALAAAIERLAEDRDLRVQMGEAAHAASRVRTPEAAAHGYLEAVEAALGASRRGG